MARRMEDGWTVARTGTPNGEAGGTNMAEMLECLVSYCSEDTNAEGLPHRCLAYHVVMDNKRRSTIYY